MEVLATLTHQVLALGRRTLPIAGEGFRQAAPFVAAGQRCIRPLRRLEQAARQELTEALLPTEQILESPVHLQLEGLLERSQPGIEGREGRMGL
jgi:hypothetical protein